MSLVLVPISSDETATAYCDSVGEYIEGQEAATLDNLRAIAEQGHEVVLPNLEEMTPEERGEYLAEELCLYTIDQLVVIDEKHLPLLKELSDKALDHGRDSALYAACEMFNDTVRELGVKTIPFHSDLIEPFI